MDRPKTIRRAPARAGVPSGGALRALRRLAFAGSAFGVIGGVCTVATISYEIQRRIHIAERYVENKRALRSCPEYNPNGGRTALAKMMDAAEAGESFGPDGAKGKTRLRREEVGSEGADVQRTSEGAGFAAPATSNKRDQSILGPVERMALPSSSMALNVNQQLRLVHEPKIGYIRRRTPSRKVHVATAPSSDSDMPEVPERPTNLSITQNLLKEGKEIEAARRLMNFTPGREIPESEALSHRVFDANIQRGNIPLAMSLLRWIDKHHKVTVPLWSKMMHRLAKRDNWNTLAEIYCRYSAALELPEAQRTTVVRSLICTYRFQEAKEMVFEYLEGDKTHALGATYLRWLWKRSRSEQLVVSQLRALMEAYSSLGMPLGEALFCPAIRAYIEAGYYEKAEELLGEMEKTCQIIPGVESLGLIAYGKALMSDWEAVEEVFKNIGSWDQSSKNTKLFQMAFDRVFLEYFLAHSAKEIRDFVFRAIDKHGLVLNGVIFEHIIWAYVQKGDSEFVKELLEVTEKRKWPLHVEREYFLEVLRKHRSACDKSVPGLWSMFRAAREKYGRAVVSNRMLGFDKLSLPLEEAYTPPDTDKTTVFSRQSGTPYNMSKRIDNFAALHLKMIHKMHAGKMKEALDLYRNARNAGLAVRPLYVKLAVVASILLHRTEDEARLILEEERRTFDNFDKAVSPPYLLKILEGSSERGQVKRMKRALNYFYKVLDEQKMPIKHNITTSMIAQMVHDDEAGHALRLIRMVNQSKYGAIAPFDIAGLKIIARASAFAGNLEGVQWAILTALNRRLAASKRQPSLDRDFVVEIRSIISYMENVNTLLKDSEKDTLRHQINYLKTLTRTLDRSLTSDEPLPATGTWPSASSAPKAVSNEEDDVFTVTWNSPYGKSTEQQRPTGMEFKLLRGVSSLTPHERVKNWHERMELEKALGTNGTRQFGAPPGSFPDEGVNEDDQGVAASTVG